MSSATADLGILKEDSMELLLQVRQDASHTSR